MDFRDFLEQIGESSNHGNRGVVPERGHAPGSVTPHSSGIKKTVPPISEQWVDTFTKNPISGSDCSKVIAGKQLKQTADKANDDRTLAKDVRRLNALLAKEAARGNYSCEVQSDFFSANIVELIKLMTVQGIKAEVKNDIVYMSWKK